MEAVEKRYGCEIPAIMGSSPGKWLTQGLNTGCEMPATPGRALLGTSDGCLQVSSWLPPWFYEAQWQGRTLRSSGTKCFENKVFSSPF